MDSETTAGRTSGTAADAPREEKASDADECELCGDETDFLRLTSDSHPEGPNLMVCPDCSEVETDGGVQAADATAAVGPSPPGTCTCGRPADGYDAELGRAVCASCARFIAAVREPTTMVVDPEPAVLRAGIDVEEIVADLETKKWTAKVNQRSVPVGSPTYQFQKGRADAFRHAISLLTGNKEGSNDA